MRSGVVAIITFLCCVLAIVCVMTIGSFNLQSDEMERAIEFTAEQTARHCIAEKIDNEDEISLIAANTFRSQINSKKGTLHFFVLYADENIIDIAAELSYAQYNGSKKEISCRKTLIRDWEEGEELESEIRFISAKYFSLPYEDGGLKDDSVWRENEEIVGILNNHKDKDGNWPHYKKKVEIKKEN